jgi:ligand-binding sensor domain-containing protein
MTALGIRRFSSAGPILAFLGRSCLNLGACLAILILCAPANALDPNRHISQYGHTGWRVQDGAIDPAGEITQTADGYLWLGTSNGLFRFDGVKFVPFAPPGLNLPTRGFTFLLGARDSSRGSESARKADVIPASITAQGSLSVGEASSQR